MLVGREVQQAGWSEVPTAKVVVKQFTHLSEEGMELERSRDHKMIHR